MRRIMLFIKNDFFRMGMAASIKQYKNNTVLREETEWSGVEENINNCDMLIMTFELACQDDLKKTENIRRAYPSIKIVLISNENEKVMALTYMKIGIEGVCLQTISEEEFHWALDSIIDGNKYVFEDLNYYFLDLILNKNSLRLLSLRESHVLHLLLKGRRTLEICRELQLAASTVSTVKLRVYQKMQVNNVIDLVEKMASYSRF
ncbi:response regulator transcription factor [Dyadobacter diqingensis]|uniref:response regulator transcription factor n=1 Tax=Dyadobacter diqingensis TaxID=2938121 RepID=UPI0020C1ADD3|nr:LuxR C-terminal-related transcriptional regulator [Dyadobacter diqingensis]